MKKFILLLLISETASSCAEDKKFIEREDVIGEWKEIQRRNTNKVPVFNIPDCGDKNATGELYTFNVDSTYTVKSICPGGEPEEKGTWIYRDHVLSLTKDSINIKFSLTHEDRNKIRFNVISWENNGVSHVDMFKLGTYSVFEKQ